MAVFVGHSLRDGSEKPVKERRHAEHDRQNLQESLLHPVGSAPTESGDTTRSPGSVAVRFRDRGGSVLRSVRNDLPREQDGFSRHLRPGYGV